MSLLENCESIHKRIKEHDRDMRLARSQFQNTLRLDTICSGTRLSLLTAIRTGTPVGVKQDIHLKLHHGNINKCNGIKILETWMPTITTHQSIAKTADPLGNSLSSEQQGSKYSTH